MKPVRNATPGLFQRAAKPDFIPEKGQKWALRRKAAARHLDGAFYTLRKQRGNYVPT